MGLDTVILALEVGWKMSSSFEQFDSTSNLSS